MAKYLVEFIGTFFLVATVGFTGNRDDIGSMAPVAIGSALMVMIFAGGHVSGGHYNPAVTLAVWLRGKCPVSDVIPYVVSQVLAAVLAAFVVVYMMKGGMPSYSERLGAAGEAIPKIFLAEFLFTFALCYVVLNVATAKGTSGNSFYGLAIGFTVLTGAYAVGGISGGAFNPAVAVGITMMGLSAVANIWILLLGEIAGAVAAVFAFKYINPGDK
jgi:aquaporin Z